MCKLLIEAGCKVNHLDKSQKSAVFFARKNNKKDTVELLNFYIAKEKDIEKNDS